MSATAAPLLTCSNASVSRSKVRRVNLLAPHLAACPLATSSCVVPFCNATVLPHRSANALIPCGLPFLTRIEVPALKYDRNEIRFSRSGVTLIALMITSNRLLSSAGMIPSKVVFTNVNFTPNALPTAAATRGQNRGQNQGGGEGDSRHPPLRNRSPSHHVSFRPFPLSSHG